MIVDILQTGQLLSICQVAFIKTHNMSHCGGSNRYDLISLNYLDHEMTDCKYTTAGAQPAFLAARLRRIMHLEMSE